VTSSEAPRPSGRFLAALFVVAFGLNWPWEMLQVPAYAEMKGRTWRATARPGATASLGDAALTHGVYGFVSPAPDRRRADSPANERRPR
jgi:hypothetical protein